MQYPKEIAATQRNLGDLLFVRNAAFVVLIAEYAYALLFNFLPDGPRLAFAGGLFVLNAILAVVAYVYRQNKTNSLILLSLLITCVCWGLSYALGYGGGGKGYTAQALAKQTGVYMIAMWVLTYPEALPRRLLAYLAMFTLIVGGGYAALAPRINLAGEEYFTHITGIPSSYSALVAGGKENLLVGARHVSASLILLNVLLIDQLRRLRVLSPAVAWSLILFGSYVIIGYWSRTNLASLSVYFVVTFYFSWRFRKVVAPLYFLIFGLSATIFLAAILYTPIEDVYYWGSGRIGTYIQRFDLLSARDWGTLLLGSGLDSDWFRSYTWLSQEKYSHNLFLNIFIERGVIGLIGLAVFLMAIYFALPLGRAKAFFWMIIAAGLIGHGFVADTQFRLMLFSGMGLAIVAANESRRGP